MTQTWPYGSLIDGSLMDRPSLRVMRWRNGALGKRLGARTGFGYHKDVPAWRDQELSREAASSSSQLKAAMPAKRPRVEEEVQTNEAVEHLNQTKGELERMRKPCSELIRFGPSSVSASRSPVSLATFNFILIIFQCGYFIHPLHGQNIHRRPRLSHTGY